MEIVNRKNNEEAFATYVDWAAEEIRQQARLRLSVGLGKIPVGLMELPGTFERFDDMEAAPRDVWIENRMAAGNGIAGVGLRMSLPAGFSYELHYGSGKADPSSDLIEGFERSLSADIQRVEVTRAYGGALSWRTPLEGLTLRGGISQMNMKAGALTQSSPLWSRAGIGGNLRGRVFNTSRIWRASAEQRIGNLRLSAEYMQNQVNAAFENSVSIRQVGEGYAGRAAYQLTDWLQLGSSYSLYYADREDRKGEALEAMGINPAGAWLQDIGVSARFDINNRMALQLEGHFMNGLLGVVEGTDEDWRRFGARMTIKF